MEQFREFGICGKFPDLELEVRRKVLSLRIPRRAPDAPEIAEFFFGSNGTYFKNLMVKQ